jgi:hypothetical protein
VKFVVNGSSPLGEVRRGCSVSCVTCSASPSPSLSHLGRRGFWSEQSGLTFSDSVLNFSKNALEISSYLRIPEAQYTKALTCKKLVSNFIVRIVEVLASVCFHNNFVFKANKIQNVSTNRLLTTKFYAKLLTAQMFPKNTLFWSHVASQLAGDIRQSHSFHYEVAKGI